MKMFSSLKLSTLKCQSNGNDNSKKNECGDDDDEISDHMYERLPRFEDKSWKCHLNQARSPKLSKNLFTKRISRWRMECPGITNFLNTHNEPNSKNNQKIKDREIPNSANQGLYKTKVATVRIRREDGNLGITLRGGFHQNTNISRPLVITNLRPDGPAAREGSIKPGDRLLAVDGISMQGSSLAEAQALLKQPSATTLLTIEYDVNVLESAVRANGPLLVEIERTADEQLGLTLFKNENGVIIERVKPGSLADRCGALHPGDEILAVNATQMDEVNILLEDVVRILESECPIVRLEILPSCSSFCNNYGFWRGYNDHSLSFETFSNGNTLKSKKIQDYSRGETANPDDLKFNNLHSNGYIGTDLALTHSETLHTTLLRENGSFGIEFVDAPDGSIIINSITLGSPAERCQCLHPGDRLLAINHKNTSLDNLTARDINDLLEFKSDAVSYSQISLHTEFDVLDTVVPASGIFTVKLVKRGSGGLGITMTGSKSSGFIICEMKKGSIAYRAGSLIPGDRLIAINNTLLDQCSVEHAAHILHQSSNVVILKVQREGDGSDFKRNRTITYTVDLQRYGGPLGITIAGSEDPFHPITISGLNAGGLAEQTGVIHIGDEILAINDHSLFGEPLSKAHNLLQNSADLVTLKLSRKIVPICRPPNRSPVMPSSSVDSAVESWDSSHLFLTPSPDQQRPLLDSQDSLQNLPPQQQQKSPSTFLVSTKANESSPDDFKSQTSDLAILDEITSENLKIKRELDLLSIKLDEEHKTKTQDQSESLLEKKQEEFNKKLLNSSEINGEISVSEGSERDIQDDPIYREVKPLGLTFKDSGNKCEERNSYSTSNLLGLEMRFIPETKNWCKNLPLKGSNQISFTSEIKSSQLYEVTLYKDPIYEDFGFSVSDGLYERGVFINRIRKGGPADISNILKPYDRILQVNETSTQDFDCCLTVPLIASSGDSLLLLVARNYEPLDENEVFENHKLYNKEISSSTSKLSSENCKELQRILV